MTAFGTLSLIGGRAEYGSSAQPMLADETSILACRQVLIGAATAWEQALAEPSAADAKVVVERLPGHFRQLEANRPTGLPLPDVGAVNRVAVGGHVIDAESDEIAAAQSAIDGEIEERQVPFTPLQLQSGTDGPDTADPQRWLRTPELALFLADRPACDEEELASFVGGLPG